MKKALLLVVFLTLLFLPTQIFAQENTGSQSAKAKVEYDLPYPGLLPDSPFYFLRATRDKVVSLLISEPLKKAEFDLLQADKRLAAAVFLANKKKYSLAVTTISKGENYFESALFQVRQAIKEGKLAGDVVSHLYLSSLKHQEVLKELENKTSGSLKASFIEEEKRAAGFEKKAKEILSGK